MKTNYYKYFISLAFLLIFVFHLSAQTKYYITAPRLFDGEVIHKEWALIFEQNKIDFLQMPLQTSFEVAFFLTKLSERYTLGLQTSMLQKAMENLN